MIQEDRPYPIYESPHPWRSFPNHFEGDTIYAPPLFHWAEVRTDWLCLDMPKREFVAELGSAWLLRYFGLRGDGNDFNFWTWQSDWLEAMLTDVGWLLEVVGQVEKALDYLIGVQQCRR